MTASETIRRLRHDLAVAMKARDDVAVAALRSALGAIDNAGAVDVAPEAPLAGEHIAGTAAGLGATEAERRFVGEDDVLAILRAEIEERSRAGAEYARMGHEAAAERLKQEAEVLAAYVSSHDRGANSP